MKVKNPSSDSLEQSELFPLNPWGFFSLCFLREQGTEREARQELFGSDFLSKPFFIFGQVVTEEPLPSWESREKSGILE